MILKLNLLKQMTQYSCNKKIEHNPSTMMIENIDAPESTTGEILRYLVDFKDFLISTRSLNVSKASCESNVPKKVLKKNCDCFAPYL